MKLNWAMKLAVCFWACSGAEALAQERSAPTKPKKAAQVADPKPEPPKSNKKKRTQKREQKPQVSTQTQLAEKSKTPTPSAAPVAAAIADDSDVRTEGDKSIKALEFTGLDIEGQLKTPQMLFFLNRLRAEFDRPRLPHRSFMPELARSREHKEL
jgi:outer membrane biosynthesis protein TonB